MKTTPDEHKIAVRGAGPAIRLIKRWPRLSAIAISLGSVYLLLLLFGVALGGCTWTLSQTTVNGVRLPQKRITLKDKAYITAEGSGVYYPAGAEDPAAEALRILCAEEHIIQETLGLKPAPFAVVLHGPMVPGKEYDTRVICPSKQTVFALAMRAGTASEPALPHHEIYDVMTHERTEGTLTGAVGKDGLYAANPYTRWIGDGLAEYLNYKVCRTLSPATCLETFRERRASLNDLPVTEFNLLIWRSTSLVLVPFMHGPDDKWAKRELDKLGEKAKVYGTTSVGYAVAFAFWKDFADKQGEAALKQFVTQLSARSDLGNKGICELLGNGTGEDFYARCSQFSIEQAKAVLDQAIAEAENSGR